MPLSDDETLCLRRMTYPDEFHLEYPGEPNRLGLCTSVELGYRDGVQYPNEEIGWHERGDAARWRANDVWTPLRRRDA